VHRFRADGVTNVSWVWDVSGSTDYWAKYGSGLYPGDDVVDWIAWDPYNWYLCHSTGWIGFAGMVRLFYDWLNAHGHGNKPFMLAEYGSRESDVDPSAKGRWLVDALGALKGGMFPDLKALIYFDSGRPECDWRIDTSQTALAGYRRLVNDSYLNP
jgi:beta-mannanase